MKRAQTRLAAYCKRLSSQHGIDLSKVQQVPRLAQAPPPNQTQKNQKTSDVRPAPLAAFASAENAALKTSPPVHPFLRRRTLPLSHCVQFLQLILDLPAVN
mmetsp:Transcript_34477/g.68190  ORF Transcript_34477/g.68190 Transcript_34477/m.68190 type:complete len:101 (-) Transcript_34477:280-582(-)